MCKTQRKKGGGEGVAFYFLRWKKVLPEGKGGDLLLIPLERKRGKKKKKAAIIRFSHTNLGGKKRKK